MQNMSFFRNLKFGNDVTKNDLINFKINLFIPALKNRLRFKIWLFHNFWIGCWTVKTLDTRWQTLKAEKGESPMSKTLGVFLVAQDMVLSHRAKIQLIINFFRVRMYFVVFQPDYIVTSNKLPSFFIHVELESKSNGFLL